jgi:rhodanese-related sulfurtransferase
MMRTPLSRYLPFDFAGATLWAGTYALVGYLFSRQIERIVMYLATLGVSIVALIALLIAAYVLYKLDQRRKFLKGLKVSRITPEELKSLMDGKGNVMILDIRNRLDRTTDPIRIPGAFHVLPEHLDFQPEDIPLDHEVVVYCTCPNEASSARVALDLQRLGIPHARPLAGGLDAWRERNLPVEQVE